MFVIFSAVLQCGQSPNVPLIINTFLHVIYKSKKKTNLLCILNNVFQYSKIRTRKRNAKKSIKTEKIWNPALFGIRNPVLGIRNAQGGIQNPRPWWIALHGAIVLKSAKLLALRYVCLSFTHPITISAPSILHYFWPLEMPNPTHPVVFASTRKKMSFFCSVYIPVKLDILTLVNWRKEQMFSSQISRGLRLYGSCPSIEKEKA